QIAVYYRADPARWAAHNGYAGRHLSTHLRAGGDQDGLFDLMDDHRWYEVQDATDPSGAAYRHDVEQAWALAEAADEAAVTLDGSIPLLGREVRCALAIASLNSRAGNLPAELLVALVRAGQWTSGAAEAAARQILDPEARSSTLLALAQEVPSGERLGVLRE